jgi:hypothetical protein
MPYSDPSKNTECTRKNRRKKRDAWIASQGGKCTKCGSRESLQIDHIDPALKSFEIHFAIKADILKKELEKCQPLCSPCHKKKTAKEIASIFPHGTEEGYLTCRCKVCTDAHYNRPTIVPHGTANGYGHYHCRCNECREAYNNETRARKKPNWKPRPKPPVRHGTYVGYTTHGCRCEICKAFVSQKAKEKRARKNLTRVPRARKPPTHGRYSTYCGHACRCDLCSKAAFDYREKKREGKRNVPPPLC